MMKKFIVLFILISIQGWAAELDNYQRPIWSMGMGGVHTVFPRSFDMPTVNAAYLRYVQGVEIEVINLALGGPGLTKIQDLQSLSSPSSLSDLNTYMGKNAFLALDGRMSVVAPYIGISGYNNFSLSLYFNNPLIPEIQTRFINDYGFTAGFAMPLGPESTFGFGFKKINRWGGNQLIDFEVLSDYISSSDTSVILDEFQNKGVGYGMDISYLYRKPNGEGPVVTLVWKDLGYTSFQKTAGNQSPPSIHDNVIAGVGYEWGGSFVGGKAGLEYRHIRTEGEQFGKKLHLGAELSLPMIDLRAGLNQGYMTYGMGFDVWVARFEMAQYTEELGVYPGQNPDPRLQIGLMVNISVDADFNISSGSNGAGGPGGSGGSRRKLKQRR